MHVYPQLLGQIGKGAELLGAGGSDVGAELVESDMGWVMRGVVTDPLQLAFVIGVAPRPVICKIQQASSYYSA